MSMMNNDVAIDLKPYATKLSDENEIQTSEPTKVQHHEKDKSTCPPNSEEIVDDDVFMQRSPMGNTVLHVAALYGNDKYMEQLFPRALSLLRVKNAKGDTPLHVAARVGHVSTLKKLLVAYLFHDSPHAYSHNPKDALYEILAKNEQENTFFHEALCNGHKEVMNILGSEELHILEAGFKEVVERAALFWTNKEEKSLLHLAIEKGYKDIVFDALKRLTTQHPALEKLIMNHRELATMIEGKLPLFEQNQETISIVPDFDPKCIGQLFGSAAADMQMGNNKVAWSAINIERQESSQNSPTAQLIPNVPPQKSPVIEEIIKQNQGTKMKSMGLGRPSEIGKHQELSQDSPIDNNVTKNHQERAQLIPYGPQCIPPGKSLLIAAILKKDKDILSIILGTKRDWINFMDNEGRTALMYAASIGYTDGVEDLLEDCKSCMERNKDGFSPLHFASAGGHTKVIKKLLEHKHCPDPREILDKYGRNIVHIAAQMGKFNVIRYVLQDANHGLVDMINDKDAQGNTPLHLATFNYHPKVVHALTWDDRVDRNSVNKNNQTAMDVCMKFQQENPTLRQRLTWIALESVGVKYAKIGSHSIEVPPPPQNAKSVNKQEVLSMDPYKDRINTLMLVSTLITTVTFAAGFTLPGGTNSSNPGQGMALMLNHIWFHVFVFCITISMYGAISVTIILIWAQLGDITLALFALKMAKPLLGVTLTTLSIAFMAGVHLVISDLSWLATTLLVLCVISVLMLMLLYIILWFPSFSRKSIMRYISYYPFQFLTWLVEKDETEGTPTQINTQYLESQKLSSFLFSSLIK